MSQEFLARILEQKAREVEQMELEVKLEEKIKKDKELPGNVTLAELHKKTITGDPMTVRIGMEHHR